MWFSMPCSSFSSSRDYTYATQPITCKRPEIEWQAGNTIIQDPLSDYLARTRSASPICSAPQKLWLKQIVALHGRNGNCLDGSSTATFVLYMRYVWRGGELMTNRRTPILMWWTKFDIFQYENVTGMYNFCRRDPVLVGSTRHSALLFVVQDSVQPSRLWNRGKQEAEPP